MGFRVNTNIDSIHSTNSLNKTNKKLSMSYEKLSSGLRINKAADDSAGLAISDKLRVQITSMSQAIRNSNDAISVIQTAEGALNEIYNNLSRIRELAVQSSSGTIQNTERTFINAESKALLNEITRLSDSTSFNGKALLNGEVLGGVMGGFVTIDVQIGVFNSGNDRLTLNFVSSSSNSLGVLAIDLTNSAGARSSISFIDNAISTISNTRATLGAYQNRLSSSLASLTSTQENMNAANNQIRDVDFATETANMSKLQVLQQAGISILSQANSSGQGALSLLR